MYLQIDARSSSEENLHVRCRVLLLPGERQKPRESFILESVMADVDIPGALDFTRIWDRAFCNRSR